MSEFPEDDVWFDEYGQPFNPSAPSDLEIERPELRVHRRVDLLPFLDGSYVPPDPEIGGQRNDSAAMLYPGRWHTMIAPTTSGKSWWAAWHVVTEVRAGRTVAYAHFEESSPAGTIERIKLLAPELTNEEIAKSFIWLDCSYRWTHEDWQRALPSEMSLLILDGINAACGQHGWVVDKTEAVGAYRSLFVTPAVRRSAAVLSLGHPPKSPDRQGERHGFGSTAWLDEVDGVGFRLRPSKDTPIRRDRHGWSNVYVVKDRYGQVEKLGAVESAGTSEGWFYVGAFHVNSAPTINVTADDMAYMTAPARDEQGSPKSAMDKLADSALQVMCTMPDRSFRTVGDLEQHMRAADHKFKASDLKPALLKLATRGLIEWPESERERAPRPGRATDIGWQYVNDHGLA